MRSIWANTFYSVSQYSNANTCCTAIYFKREMAQKASWFIFRASNFGISHLRVLPFIRAAQSIENLCFIVIPTKSCATCLSQTNASNPISYNQYIIIIHTLHDNVCMGLHRASLLKMAATCGDAVAWGWSDVEMMGKRKFSDVSQFWCN